MIRVDKEQYLLQFGKIKTPKITQINNFFKIILKWPARHRFDNIF